MSLNNQLGRWGKITPLTALLLLAAFETAKAETEGNAKPHQAWIIEPENFGGLDLEQLSRVRVITSTLTPTPIQLVPAKTTVIGSTAIAKSGARHLNELLEIYTPNTQLISHNTHLNHFGMRGIISDRDDKYLLRVNDKVMNNRMFAGAESERDLPLLDDLRTLTTVHGPASIGMRDWSTER
jgi:iron complex outermembrane receptor protein